MDLTTFAMPEAERQHAAAARARYLDAIGVTRALRSSRQQ
jgi:hypothetical protein